MDLKKTKYARIFSDVYRLMEKYYPPRDDDEYWDGLLAEADETYWKYQKSNFVKKMVLAVLEELNDIHKQKGENHEENTEISRHGGEVPEGSDGRVGGVQRKGQTPG